MEKLHLKNWLDSLLSRISGNASKIEGKHHLNTNDFHRSNRASYHYQEESFHGSQTTNSSTVTSPQSLLSGASMYENAMLNYDMESTSHANHQVSNLTGTRTTRDAIFANQDYSQEIASSSRIDKVARDSNQCRRVHAISPVKSSKAHSISAGTRRSWMDAGGQERQESVANFGDVELFVTTETSIGTEILKPPLTRDYKKRLLQRRRPMPMLPSNSVTYTNDSAMNTESKDADQNHSIRDFKDWIYAGAKDESKKPDDKFCNGMNRSTTQAIKVAPPKGGVQSDVDDEFFMVNTEHYDRATWRMYHRITNARMVAQQKQCSLPVQQSGHLRGSIFGDTKKEGEYDSKFENNGTDVRDPLRESAQYGMFPIDLERNS